jgi:hypothetical protein
MKTDKLSKDVLLGLADALKQMAGEGEKAVGTVHSGITLHGPDGIFSTFGLEREVINAAVMPQGLISELPLMPSQDTDPRFASLTGVTDSTGSQPTNACDSAPYAYMKGCNLTARFGMIRYDTNTIEFDKVITRYNRGDFMDLQMMGSLLDAGAGAAGLMPSNISEEDILNVVTLNEMLVVGVQCQRELIRQSWQGNVNLTNEFPGLDDQITTGIMDADISGKLCPALDSDVKNFGYSAVDGSSKDIVEYVSSMMWYLQFNARRMELEPVEWVLVMRPELWFELSAIWPCRYFTSRCTTIDTDNIDAVPQVRAETAIELRDAMREDMYLPVNGREYRVVLDDGINELDPTSDQNLSPGEFASSLYAVPLTILGNFPVAYREYLDYRSSVGTANVAPFAGQRRPDFWTDNGIFSWAYDGQLWCYMLGVKTEQRVILRTPQLAGRVDYIKYTPTQHLRSPFPSSDYFEDGGVSTRPATRTSYAVWSSADNNVVPD